MLHPDGVGVRPMTVVSVIGIKKKKKFFGFLPLLVRIAIPIITLWLLNPY